MADVEDPERPPQALVPVQVLPPSSALTTVEGPRPPFEGVPATTMAIRPAEPVPALYPGLTAIGPVPGERKARDWALVLQSMSVWHVIRRGYGGWALFVHDADYAAAAAAIDRYEAENRNWPPPPTRERSRHAASPVIPAVFALMVAFFLITGPEHGQSLWFARGVAETCREHLFCSVPGRLVAAAASEPWRAVTALTLHADGPHVLGNAISGTIFAGAVQRRLGAGGAMLAVLASGALGNLGNAVYHRDFLGEAHGSLGASTAVFGAIGLLAATELVLHRGDAARPRSWTEIAAPIVGGFALLGALGSGSGDGRTDLGAHLFGFLSGVMIGLAAALPLRRSAQTVDVGSGAQGVAVSLGAGAPRWWVQAAFGGLAAGAVLGAWELAMRR